MRIIKLFSIAGMFFIFLLFSNNTYSQRHYSGSRHTSSHGGHYSGGHNSSHKGGHYIHASTANHYGKHKR